MVACRKRSNCHHQALDEEHHLILLDQAISVLVDGLESIFELSLVVVVGRGDVGEHLPEERARLWLIQLAAVVFVEFAPDLVDDLHDDALTLVLGRHAALEGAVGGEVGVVDEDLDVVGEALPSDRALVFHRLAVDHAHLAQGLGLLGTSLRGVQIQLHLSLGSLLHNWHINADLATAHVLRVTLVGLDAASSARVGENTRDAESSLPGRVRDPGDVDQTIVDACERVHDRATVRVLAVVDHHEGRADAS